MRNKRFISEIEKLSPVPERLEPGNIEKKLYEKKRKRISVRRRIAGAAAAVAVAGTGAFVYLNNSHGDRNFERKTLDMEFSDTAAAKAGMLDEGRLSEMGLKTMSYDELYDYFNMYGAVQTKYSHIDKKTGLFYSFDDEENDADGTMYVTAARDEEMTTGAEHSKTYLQEKDIDEADMIKTDGKNIFFVADGKLYAIKCDGGKMENKPIDFKALFGDEYKDMDVSELYLDGEMLTCVFTNSGRYDYTCWYDDTRSALDNYEEWSETTSAVSFDITDIDDIKAINSLSIKGGYVSSRMQDGKLFMTAQTNITPYDTYEKGGVPEFAPVYKSNGEKHYISSGDILVPENYSYVNDAVIIAAADMSKKSEPTAIRSIIGMGGSIYQSYDRLFAYSSYYDAGSDKAKTKVVAFDTTDGILLPAGTADFDGQIMDRYSLRYKEGVFSAAVHDSRYDEQEGRNEQQNYLYTFDRKLKELGRSESFGEDEQIKSVFYKDDYAYAVTFMQTDPLFAIDLKDPKKPEIVSELKMPGFSTHMRLFTQGRMIGFGCTADENTGRSTGIKLSMFDVTDSNDVKEIAKEEISYADKVDISIYSMAEYDEKALLIDGEKNMIAFPYTKTDYSDQSHIITHEGYRFYSYSDEGGFRYLGEYYDTGIMDYDGGIYESDDIYEYKRCAYIGDVIFIGSDSGMVSLDMESFKEIDKIKF